MKDQLPMNTSSFLQALPVLVLMQSYRFIAIPDQHLEKLDEIVEFKVLLKSEENAAQGRFFVYFA